MRSGVFFRGAAGVAVAAGLALGVTAGESFAQGFDVAIAAAAGSPFPTNERFTDPQNKLMATGLFNSVDLIDVMNQTPTLAELQQYDAIITWTNVSYLDNVALGNVLADYVDAGGGVVVAVFATSTTTANRFLSGRWITDGYEIIVSQSGNQSGAASIGNVLDPNHPIMENVNSIFGSTIFRPAGTALTGHGELIAEWDDGRILAAVSNQFPNRVDLGLYPPSSDVSASWWIGDGAELLANSLVFTINGTDPCPPDWNGDGVVDSDDLFDFLADWAAGDADYNGDGVTDSDDLFEFLADWANPGQFPGC